MSIIKIKPQHREQGVMPCSSLLCRFLKVNNHRIVFTRNNKIGKLKIRACEEQKLSHLPFTFSVFFIIFILHSFTIHNLTFFLHFNMDFTDANGACAGCRDAYWTSGQLFNEINHINS